VSFFLNYFLRLVTIVSMMFRPTSLVLRLTVSMRETYMPNCTIKSRSAFLYNLVVFGH